MDYNDVIKQIEATDSNFGSVVDDAQKRMLREVLTLTKDLELSNGRIMPTVGNLKLISKIKEKLNKAVVNKDYLSGVKDLLKSFDSIQSTQIGYFKSISEGKPTQQKYDLVRGMAIENTAAQLTESGIDANVTSKLKDMLLRSVTSGVKYSDLVGEVSEFLSNTDKSPGALSRYAKTYTTTALNQFAGQTNKLILEDSGAEWFRYTGSDIETTREFCDLMTDKDYFHKSEIPELLKGHIDGKKCEIYDKTGLPKGMIEGTNKDNFFVNRGGWNCGHQIVPVLSFTVPKNLRDKFNANRLLNTEKEIPKAEKGIIFEPAKNANEIKVRMQNIGINKYNMKDIDLNTQNLILESAESVMKSSNVVLTNLGINNRQNSIAWYKTGTKEIEFNSSKINNHVPRKVADLELKIKEVNERLEKYQSYLGDNRYSQNQVKKGIKDLLKTKTDIENKIKSGEKPLLFSYGSDFEKSKFAQSVFYHEFGHAIRWQNKIRPGTDYNFDKSKAPSEYAKTNYDEYFAENYAKYKMEGSKDIPNDLVQIFKKFD